MPHPRFSAVLFDKDGTLVDFHRTWDPAIAALVQRLATETDASSKDTATAIGFDLDRGRLLPHTPVRTESTAQMADRLAGVCGRERGDEKFSQHLDELLPGPC